MLEVPPNQLDGIREHIAFGEVQVAPAFFLQHHQEPEAAFHGFSGPFSGKPIVVHPVVDGAELPHRPFCGGKQALNQSYKVGVWHIKVNYMACSPIHLPEPAHRPKNFEGNATLHKHVLTGMQSEHMLVIRSKEAPGCVMEVMEYQKLLGNPKSASEMYYREKQGIRLKTLRATLSGGKFVAEPGQLQYMKGNLELKVESGGGMGGFLQRAVNAALTGETVFKTEYTGSGMVFLEPTWKNYLLLDISEDLIIDRGIFVAGAGDLRFSVKKPDSILGNALSGEGLFQTQIGGSGVVALYSPVPEAELMIAELTGDKLVVDGNFAIARTAGVRMSVQKSSKGILASAQSGEGLVTVFEGTGQVWLTPTVNMY